jgi:hypothetical protein
MATGSNIINNGVAEITIPYTVDNIDRNTVESWVEGVVKSALGKDEDFWTHVMYVLPNSVNFGTAAAYAYVGWSRSVYKGRYASVLLVQMHELGHNLDMRHSGYKGAGSYDDKSCFMGTFSSVACWFHHLSRI